MSCPRFCLRSVRSPNGRLAARLSPKICATSKFGFEPVESRLFFVGRISIFVLAASVDGNVHAEFGDNDRTALEAPASGCVVEAATTRTRFERLFDGCNQVFEFVANVRAKFCRARVAGRDFCPLCTGATRQMPLVIERGVVNAEQLLGATRAVDDGSIQPIVIRVITHGSGQQGFMRQKCRQVRGSWRTVCGLFVWGSRIASVSILVAAGSGAGADGHGYTSSLREGRCSVSVTASGSRFLFPTFVFSLCLYHV